MKIQMKGNGWNPTWKKKQKKKRTLYCVCREQQLQRLRKRPSERCGKETQEQWYVNKAELVDVML